MILTSVSWPILSALSAAAFVAGFVDSIAGGGGIINIPALLLAGLPPHEALGTNKLASTFGTLNASRIFWKKELLDPKPWLGGLGFMFIGSVIGVLAAHYISPEHLKKMLPWLIMVVAIYFSSPFAVKKSKTPPDLHPALWKSGALGLGMGFYDGFFGPGTGAFLAALGMICFSLPIMKSMAMARFFNVSSNLAALLIFSLFGQVNFVIGLGMAVANTIGGQLGAHSAIKLGTQFIRYFFILIVICMVAKLML